MIKSLTSLRGIFILFIFFHHCLLFPGGGTMGVAFFFVLGGFTMTFGYKDKVLCPTFSYKQYLSRRCIKFYPLHWLCMLAVLPLALLSFKLEDIPVFFTNAALLHTWIPIKSYYLSLNWVSWYLADTLFFAVVFPLIFKLIINCDRAGKGLIALLFSFIYIVISVTIPPDNYYVILYISPYIRLTDFVFGIYLALFFYKIKETPVNCKIGDSLNVVIVWILILLLVVESSCLPENATLFAPVYWPLVALVILTTSFNELRGGGKFWKNHYLQCLGELTFIIFMIHQIVQRYITVIFEKVLHFDSKFIYVALSLVITILASIVLDKYILKPITQWLTKKIQPYMTARS